MYPLLSSSLSHFCRASSSLGGNGYSLQSMVSGASGFRVIAWSHGLEGGSFFDSTGSNMRSCNWPRVLPLAMCPCKFLNRLIVD